jgi:hypothetical protein
LAYVDETELSMK